MKWLSKKTKRSYARKRPTRKRLLAWLGVDQAFPSWDANWQRIATCLYDNQIRYFYHFTDYENLSSILANGILSKSSLDEQQIPHKRSGSSQSQRIDVDRGTYNHVHLSFREKTKMLYSKINEGVLTDPIIVRIKSTIALQRETKWCGSNSIKMGASISSDPADLERLQYDIIYSPNKFARNSLENDLFQSEIIVKDLVSKDYLEGWIHFYSGEFYTPPKTIDANFYSSGLGYGATTFKRSDPQNPTDPQNTIELTLVVPLNSQVYVNDVKTEETGRVRILKTYACNPEKKYRYRLLVSYEDQNQKRTVEDTIVLWPGSPQLKIIRPASTSLRTEY